jgi:hypothetical protein
VALSRPIQVKDAVSESSFDLRGTFHGLVRVLRSEGIAHAFIGALPVLAWGRVRATTDIDLVVAVGDSWDRLRAALNRMGLNQQRQIGPADPTDALPDVAVFFSSSDRLAVRVDVFIAKTDFELAVIDSAREATVFDMTVRLARPEASIIYKLLAQRPRDLDDVESIFEARKSAGEILDWSFLDSWAEAWEITDHLVPYRNKYGPQS